MDIYHNTYVYIDTQCVSVSIYLPFDHIYHNFFNIIEKKYYTQSRLLGKQEYFSNMLNDDMCAEMLKCKKKKQQQ